MTQTPKKPSTSGTKTAELGEIFNHPEKLQYIFQRIEQDTNLIMFFKPGSVTGVATNRGYCRWITQTSIGKSRCIKTYEKIEAKLERRQTPFVTMCYAGFLIFAVPILIDSKIIGTLFTHQLFPAPIISTSESDEKFLFLNKQLNMSLDDNLKKSFAKINWITPCKPRHMLLNYMKTIADMLLNTKTDDQSLEKTASVICSNISKLVYDSRN